MKAAKEWITYSGSASIYMLAADDSHFNDAVIASGRRIREPLLARDHHSLVASKKILALQCAVLGDHAITLQMPKRFLT